MSFQGTQKEINTFIMGRQDLSIRAVEALAHMLPDGLEKIRDQLVSAYFENKPEMSEPYRLGVEDAFETLFKSKEYLSGARNRFAHVAPFVRSIESNTWHSSSDRL